MAFSIKKFTIDVTERAASTGWQAALGGAIAANLLHNPTWGVGVAAGLSVAKSLLVKFYQSNAEAQKIEKELAPIVKDVAPIVKEVAPVVAAAYPAFAPVVTAVADAIPAPQ